MTREILICNDDSISAKGIREVAQLMRQYGDVTVVAPKYQQSAKGASITMDSKFYLEFLGSEEPTEELGGIRYYCMNGTPVDCTKMGINMFIDEGRMPDMFISGINHGANFSIASLYSGTLGAAAEAAVYQIPSIGLSLCDMDCDDFSTVLYYIPEIMEQFIANPPKNGTYLNINFPSLPIDEINGIRFGHQGKGQWIKEFDYYEDSEGEYYVMAGEYKNLEDYTEDNDADHLMVQDGYISIVPHTIDTTDYSELERLRDSWSL